MLKLSGAQRTVLWFVSAIGLFGINGLFLYAALFRPEQMGDVQSHLVGLAFMLEAFVLLPLFCYLIAIAQLKRPGWVAFLLLSLAGSLAFSIPFSILMWSREKNR